MDIRNCHVVAEEEAHERLAFFTSEENWRWKVMPIGGLNEAPTFVSMLMNLQMEWDTPAKECGLKNVASKMIVDNVLLYGSTAGQLQYYLRTVLDVPKHHHATLKLKKCKRFQDMCKFVGMDVAAGGTQPAQSKNEAFDKL